MGISIWQLLIILAIVLVLFGAKRLRSLGTDLGGAIKNFRSAVRESEEKPQENTETEEKRLEQDTGGHVIDGEVTAKEKKQV